MNLEPQDNVLNDVFDGDERLMKKSLARSLRKTMFWDDIQADLNVLPEWEEGRQNLFRIMLGWVPDKEFTVRYDAFIKVAIKRYKTGQIDYDSFEDEVGRYIVTIRNRELAEHNDDYEPEYFEMYNTHRPEYKDIVRERICKVLGYKPELNTSLIVELCHRNLYAFKPECFLNDITTMDLKAASVIKYRERVLTYGVEKAKTMDFVGPLIMERYRKGEIIF